MEFRWRSSGRQGSALLIVLGMFAFMLVSAVSFSIYMRASRAPSSYVRRNASARHLVKAALARAIDEIDMAIGNDPFPGVGYNHDYGNDGLNQGDRLKNDNWHGRVFTPSNEVAHADTVSTLTLEALGYLPPCLIDEVRYWSRHTRTAKWHSFNYGLGQYAFTAVNVSDLFDLNQFIDVDGVEKQRLNRSSSDYGRISPAYLFRSSNTGDMDTGGSAAAAFLSAMSDGSGFGASPSLQDVPFVSMMDYNLAMGGTALGGLASPFMSRLNGSSGTFYSGAGGDDVVRRQVFMAGGWNGDSNLTYQAYNGAYGGRRINLQYPEYQPFAGYGWFPEATTLSHCYNDVAEGHPFWQPLNKDFPILSTALLCDYLDYDNVPLSLCIPCTEAVPMICGVELNDNCVKYNVAVAETELQAANAEQGIKRKIKRTYSMKVDVRDLEATVTTVYPFMNGPQGQDANYTIEAFARVFFTTESAKGDGDLTDVGLRSSASGLGMLDKAQWDWSGTTAPAYIQVTCGDKSLQVRTPSGVGEAAELDAIKEDNSLRMSGNLMKEGALADLVYEIDDSGKEVLVEAECKGYADSFMFFENWIAWDGDKVLESFKNDSNAGIKFRPSVAVWVRIKNGNDKTVDIVPATPANDDLNDFPANKDINKFSQAMGGVSGDPLLRFFPKKEKDDGVILTKVYFQDNKDAVRDVEWKQKAYIANDPRINWAPEQWWATDQTASPKQLWFENVKTFRENNSWCDSDIFMAASDQGYMQSVYEWMFIPQVLRIRKDALNYDTNGANLEWGVFEDGNGYDGEVNTAANDVLHRDVMWRTHRSRAFLEGPGNDNWDWGRIDLLPFDDSVRGLRINPYTDITNIMMGAFANMPNGWWAAGTNHLASGKNYMAPNSSSFKSDYLFDWSCNYNDVYRMSTFWMSVFKYDADNLYCTSGRPDSWMERLDGYLHCSVDVANGFVGGMMDVVDWFNGDVLLNNNSNFGPDVQAILQNMSLADRKFLYGYLKGCFANTHQLFLIFVRAESAAGGGGAGSGARAVALVWRDPNAPSNGGLPVDGVGKDNAQAYLNLQSGANEESWRLNKREYPPHKTRILFYHQLD